MKQQHRHPLDEQFRKDKRIASKLSSITKQLDDFLESQLSAHLERGDAPALTSLKDSLQGITTKYEK